MSRPLHPTAASRSGLGAASGLSGALLCPPRAELGQRTSASLRPAARATREHEAGDGPVPPRGVHSKTKPSLPPSDTWKSHAAVSALLRSFSTFCRSPLPFLAAISFHLLGRHQGHTSTHRTGSLRVSWGHLAPRPRPASAITVTAVTPPPPLPPAGSRRGPCGPARARAAWPGFPFSPHRRVKDPREFTERHAGCAVGRTQRDTGLSSSGRFPRLEGAGATSVGDPAARTAAP